MRSGMMVCAMAYKSGLSALADKPVSGDLPGVRDSGRNKKRLVFVTG